MIKIYGLKNCDTCRKAQKWLESEAIGFTFFDVRQDGIAEPEITKWIDAVGWEELLNRRGTTWRGLSEDLKADLTRDKTIRLMVEYPALMKRPIFVFGDGVVVGFKQAQIDILKRLTS